MRSDLGDHLVRIAGVVAVFLQAGDGGIRFRGPQHIGRIHMADVGPVLPEQSLTEVRFFMGQRLRITGNDRRLPSQHNLAQRRKQRVEIISPPAGPSPAPRID